MQREALEQRFLENHKDNTNRDSPYMSLRIQEKQSLDLAQRQAEYINDIENRKDQEKERSKNAKREEVNKWMQESIKAKQMTDRNNRQEREREKQLLNRGQNSFETLTKHRR